MSHIISSISRGLCKSSECVVCWSAVLLLQLHLPHALLRIIQSLQG